jgi:hypothetical protein
MADHPKNFQQLWRQLGSERRRIAANALLEKGDRTQQTLAANLIATKLNFRPHKAAALPPERKAHYIAGMESLDEAMAGALIRDYLFAQHRPMLSRFLDTLAIPHKEGEIEEGADVAKPAPDALKTAVEAIRSEFNPEEVAIYTNALAISDPDLWGELRNLDAASPKEDRQTA